MSKRIYLWLLLPGLLVATYLVGPQVPAPELSRNLPEVPSDLKALENYVNRNEGSVTGIKEDNQARIIWGKRAYQKTEYSLVYLHGWSASQAEGAPVHEEIAQRYGVNLYLARLAGHGLVDSLALKELTAEDLLLSAKEAIAISGQLGDKVILFGTSTGATLSLYLAPSSPKIAGLVLYSPNIKIKEAASIILDDPWGYEIARLVSGSDYHSWRIEPERKPYWSNSYPLRALTHLQALVESTMTEEVFAEVKVPVFMGYYYKNDTAQDQTVSVPAMLEMFEQLGTPDALKRKRSFPEAGEHVIGSYLVSEDLESVREETFRFLEEIIGLTPLSDSSSMSGTSQSE